MRRFLCLRKICNVFQVLTRQDAVQVVLYYNNNKEIKGEKKHLGNSVFSIKCSHLFVEVNVMKKVEKKSCH